MIYISGRSLLYFMSEHYQIFEIKQANKAQLNRHFPPPKAKNKNNLYLWQLKGWIARDDNVNVRSSR